jgi:phosphate transport system substrate-binding protein
MKTRTPIRLAAIAILGTAALGLAVACGDDDDDGGTSPTATAAAATGATGSTGTTGSTGGGGGSAALSGAVQIDGSSTVFPITEAVAEEFRGEEAGVRVTVGVSGTGGGFSRFCAGETDISDASRPISEDEQATCETAGIEYIEIPVAYDGLAVVKNPDNDWATCITTEELATMWSPDSEGSVTSWSQVNSAWPNEELVLYGPGTDSGTFDYFTDEINGEEGASRTDYTPSEDDNVLVQGVAGGAGATGYFGLAYLVENEGTIAGIQVDAGDGCVDPTPETVLSGEYPLSRPLFIYVKVEAAERPEVQAFVDFYLENVPDLAPEVGYVQFPEDFYTTIGETWEARTPGTIFSGADGTVGEILGVQ